MEVQYGFTIDSTLIKEVESDNYTSYTFLINRDFFDKSYFENLVVTIDSSAIPKAYIIKYTLNSKPIYISEHDAYTLDAKTEITPIEYNIVQAKQIYTDFDGCIVTRMCPYDNEGSGPHPANGSCFQRDDLYWSEPDCGDTGGGGIPADNTDDSTGNPSSSGSNSNENSDPSPHGSGGDGSGDIITTPNLPEFLDNEPCKDLKDSISNNPVIMQKLKLMFDHAEDNGTTGKGEWGLKIKKNPSTNQYSPENILMSPDDRLVRINIH